MALTEAQLALVQAEIAKLPAAVSGALPKAVQDVLRTAAPDAVGDAATWLFKALAGGQAGTAPIGVLPAGLSFVAAADFVSALERAEIEHQKAALDLVAGFTASLFRALLAALV